MKKINYLVGLLGIGLIIGNSGILHSMESEQETSTKNWSITLGGTKFYLSTLAVMLAIPTAYLVYLATKYGKTYGLGVILVANRYDIPFGTDQLQMLKYAANHEDQLLKNSLLSFNKTLLGEDWRQVRPKLAHDFMTMNVYTLTKKYSWATYKQMSRLLKLYSAASDLYFRKSKKRTYIRGTPSATQQVKYMHEFDQKLGIE